MSAPVIRPGASGKASRVRLFLLDVDGVLTDGGIVYDDAGTESKRFHVRDGHGIVMLRRAGIETGIITGRTSKAVDVRARELGVAHVRQGAFDKVAAWNEILAATGCRPEESAYVGDDIVDLPLLRRAGFSAAVADAEEAVLSAVDFVSGRPGGSGAVREIIDFILRSRGAWDAVTARYFTEAAE